MVQLQKKNRKTDEWTTLKLRTVFIKAEYLKSKKNKNPTHKK